MCLGVGWVRVDVPRDDPRFGVAQPCPSCSLVQERRQARLFRMANIPPYFANVDFASYPVSDATVDAVRELRRWATNPPPLPRSLFIWGSYGVGKTGLALSILRARVLDTGAPSLFLTTPTLLDRIRATYSRSPDSASEPEVLGAVKNTTLLVLDDVGSERVNDWVQEKLFVIINHRHDYHMETIFTSNLSPAQLVRHLGERTAWRILEMCAVVHLDGPNLRLPDAGEQP
jgi:DNA replication protein DnaC